jgi:hypothetical protein
MKKAPKKAPLPFLANQVFGSGGAFLQNFAISLGSATLVGALQGVEFAFLLMMTILLARYLPQLREDFSRQVAIQKVLATIIVAMGLVILAFG